MKGFHVTIAFWVLEGELKRCVRFELDSAGVVEGGLFDWFAFNANLTEAVGVLGCEGAFSNGAVTN